MCIAKYIDITLTTSSNEDIQTTTSVETSQELMQYLTLGLNEFDLELWREYESELKALIPETNLVSLDMLDYFDRNELAHNIICRLNSMKNIHQFQGCVIYSSNDAHMFMYFDDEEKIRVWGVCEGILFSTYYCVLCVL